MANDLEKWELPKYIGGAALLLLAMVFGMPLMYHLFAAWDRWLTKALGN